MSESVGIVSGLLTGVETAGKIFSQNEARKSRERALQSRLEQEKAATNERVIKTLKRSSDIFDAQQAGQSVSGFTLSSPSFGAIQKDSLNEASKDVNAENLNFLFKKTAIENKQKSINDKTNIGIGLSLFDAGSLLNQDRKDFLQKRKGENDNAVF